MQGIDVSHYQGTIDWAKVKSASIEFAFIKATEGSSEIDPKFFENTQNASTQNITCGAYHFFQPNSDASQQAQHFINTIKQSEYNHELLALDVEINEGLNPNELLQKIKIILTSIQNELNVTPLIYTTASFWDQHIQTPLPEYPLWIADWEQSHQPTLPQGWTSYQYWQYANNGHIDGISGTVDLNRS